MTDKQEKTRHQETECKDDIKVSVDKQCEQLDAPCHEEHRFITVRHGDGARDDPSQCQTDGQAEERQCHNNQGQGLSALEDGQEQTQESHGEVNHKEDRGERNAVVDTLCRDLRVGRNTVSTITILVFLDLGNHLTHILPVFRQCIAVEYGEGILHILLLFLLDVLRIFIHRTVPDGGVTGIGEYFQQFALS